jgi:hypothetical protein
MLTCFRSSDIKAKVAAFTTREPAEEVVQNDKPPGFPEGLSVRENVLQAALATA